MTVRVGVLDDGDGFYCEDDGPGVPPAEQQQAFESGYSNSERGTGFGPSIVEEIAQTHGESVALTGSDAGGARFEIGDVRRP